MEPYVCIAFAKPQDQHRSIDELIDHLLSMLVSYPLDKWERRGARLHLNR